MKAAHGIYAMIGHRLQSAEIIVEKFPDNIGPGAPQLPEPNVWKAMGLFEQMERMTPSDVSAERLAL